MRNTNTTYSPSDSLPGKETSCFLQQKEKDTIRICNSGRTYMPQNLIHGNSNLSGSLLFSVIFLIILAFIRLRGKDLLPTLFSILIKRKKIAIVQTEGISPNLVCYMLALFLSFSVISTGFVYLTTKGFSIFPILYIVSGLLVYHFFFLGLFNLMGWTFNSRNTASEAIISLWTYHIMMGVIVAPFVIASFFVKSFAIMPLLNIVISTLAVFEVFKFIRWIQILFSHRVSILYMILYLCALEVMPILIIIKIVA